MQIRPKHDFPIKVGLQLWEEPDEMPSVTFVPRTRKTAANWPPPLPDNTDDIKTAEEARLLTLGLERYSVMPDEERAGAEEVIFHPGFEAPESGGYIDPSEGVVFFTTADEYEVLADEALERSMRAGGQLSVPVSEIADTSLARFLLRSEEHGR